MATAIQASGFEGLEEITLEGNRISLEGNSVTKSVDAQNQKDSNFVSNYFNNKVSVLPSIQELTPEFDISDEDLQKMENGKEDELPNMTIPDSDASKAEAPKKTNKVAKALIITAFVLGALILIAGIAAAAFIILGPAAGLPAVALPFALV